MSELLDDFAEFADFFDHVAAPTAQVPTPERVPGYVSAPRKKDGRWTEEEHRLFLLGLDRCSGKRKWKQISQQYVVSRTSIQVASHAQKHFIGNGIPLKERRRRSINDTTLKDMDMNVTPHMNQPIIWFQLLFQILQCGHMICNKYKICRNNPILIIHLIK